MPRNCDRIVTGTRLSHLKHPPPHLQATQPHLVVDTPSPTSRRSFTHACIGVFSPHSANSTNPYIQHAVGWLDRYCFANTDKSFASALKLMVKEVEPE